MRVKFIEILKFIVCVAIGFTIRIMFENSHKIKDFQKNCISKKDFDSDFLNDVHEQLRQPYQPKSLLDVIEFRYFNLSMVLDTHLGQIGTKVKSYHHSDIRDIISQIISQINHGDSNKYVLKSLLNGFERIDPVRGKEYVLDLELFLNNQKDPISAKRIHRLNIIKPFNYIQIVSNIDVTPVKDNLINIIYYCGDSHIRFIEPLLKYHEDQIINFFPVNVTICLCSTKNSNDEIIVIINKFLKKHESVKSYKLHLKIENDCNFKANSIINKAVKQLGNGNSKLVILDINTNITHQFLKRCFFILKEKSSSVYNPIPFAEFLNKDPVYIGLLTQESGYWDHENREILCINQKLFNKVGGLDENQTKVDAHVSLINKLIKFKMEIFRSTDPSVRISYHYLDCKAQEMMFLSSFEYCETRRKKTFQSFLKSINSLNLP